MLKQKLAQMAAASAAKVPPETRKIMAQAKEELAASGILERAIKVGAKVTDFSLPDSAGNPVELATLRQRGPVMLTIYRGVW